MEKLQSYEQYSQVLAAFKQGRARCATNKMMMRDELTALIEAGKLYYEQIGDTLWFFSDEDYFYSAHLYAPADRPIQMEKQDKDVEVELMGNESRYNVQMDRELVAAGFEKGGKYLEYGSFLEDFIEMIRSRAKVMRAFWEKRGFTYRKATKADYPELRKQWLIMLGEDSYNVLALTDAQLDEMEKYGRCPVICDPQGRIVASSTFFKSGNLAYDYITETVFKKSGLGGSVAYERAICEYEEGCTKQLTWVREDNAESSSGAERVSDLTGKYLWQFVYRNSEWRR